MESSFTHIWHMHTRHFHHDRNGDCSDGQAGHDLRADGEMERERTGWQT